MAFFGVYRHPTVIAHMLVAAGGHIEKGCLAAIGIPYKGDTYGTGILGIIVFLGRNINQGRLRSTKRDFIPQNLIFNRIFQRGIHNGGHLFPRNKAHLYEPFPEITLAADLYHDASIPCLQIR